MRRARACRIAAVVLSGLMLAPALPGCVKKRKAESEAAENPLKPQPGGAPAQNVVQRGVQRQVNQQLLRDIGQFYQLYRTEHGRAPQNLQDFLGYLKTEPRTRQPLENSSVVMVFTPEPSGSQVLAYEKEAFQEFQNRLVLLGDGSVHLMPEAEFQAALKAR